MELVTSCRELKNVSCLHTWYTDGPGRHRCFVSAHECDRHTIINQTNEEKVSKCRDYG